MSQETREPSSSSVQYHDNQTKLTETNMIYSDIKSIEFGKLWMFGVFDSFTTMTWIIIIPLYMAQYFGGCLDLDNLNRVHADCIPNYTKLAQYFSYILPLGAAVQFAFSAFIGRLTDSYGRKLFLIISTFLWLIPTAMMCFYFNIWVFSILVIIAQIISTTIAISGAIADIIKPDDRTNAFGKFTVSYGIGALLGVILANILSQIYGNHNIVFYISAIGYILLIGYIIFVMDETIDINKNRRPFTKNAIRNPLRPICYATQNKLILFICLTSLSVVFSTGYFVIYPSYIGTELQLNDANETLIYSVSIGIAAIMSMISNGVLLPILQKKINDINIIILNLVLDIISLVLLGLIAFYPNLYVLFASAFIGGIASVIGTVLNGIISKVVSKSCQGTVFGILKTYNQIAVIFSPLISGLVYVELDVLGHRYGIMIFSIFVCVITMILTIVPLKRALNKQYDLNKSIHLLDTIRGKNLLPQTELSSSCQRGSFF